MTDKTLTQLYSEHTGKVSDKWAIYLNEYDRIFEEYRNKPRRLLEIGIQNGGSLEIWSKYFPHAQKLIGCDINPECARLVYEDPRIAAVTGDANSDETQTAILEHSAEFDIIIDDGSHRSSDIVKSFARYFPHLVDGGVFVVEDLHCSYWAEYQGGLFDPFSSITFFKRLADVINYQHWGVEKSSNEILSGFFSKYGFQIEGQILQHIHSVEFINSMCVIRKAKPQFNRLGTRVIAGSTELVVPGHLDFSGLQFSPDQVPSQSSNEWAARSMPPDEELLIFDEQMSQLKRWLLEDDGEIDKLRLALETKEHELRDRDNRIEELESQINQLQQWVREDDTLLNTLTQQVREKEASEEYFKNQMLDRESQIAHFSARTEEMESSIIHLQNELESMRQSISWRITTPVRFVGRTVHRGK